MNKFKSIKDEPYLNPLPIPIAIVDLIERSVIGPDEELEGINGAIRAAKTRGYNAALADLLEHIENHRRGIIDLHLGMK